MSNYHSITVVLALRSTRRIYLHASISTTINSMGAQIDESSKLLDGLNTSKNIIVDNITSVSATSEQTAALNEVYHHAMKLDEMVKEMDGKINQFDLKN